LLLLFFEQMRSLFAIAVLACACAVLAEIAEHRITNLPGIDNSLIKFAQYAGYITVNEEKGRNFFYWFVESQNDPKNDPVILWLNGGPGSSSLIGFFVEHGPFRQDVTGKNLTINPHSWNKVANIIYLESPSYVGFSYSNDEKDWKTDDDIVAKDNYEFLKRWFQAYPEFRKNDFYVTGESYGGHYVPQLCEQILLQDTKGEINMKGLMAGNAAVNSDFYEVGEADARTDAWSFLTFMYTHGYVPHSAYAEVETKCNWKNYMSDCAGNYTRPGAECLKAQTAALQYIPDNIDLYNVDAYVCLDDQYFSYASKWSYGAHFMAQRRMKQKAMRGHENYDPCIFTYMTTYLNLPEVQTAIHARPGTEWSGFAALDYSDDSVHRNTIPLFQEFLTTARSQKWRILIYSGDFDAAVPFLGSQKWVHCLGRPVKKDWRSWNFNKQFAGGLIEYDGITFLTVHGTGHAIPWYTPALGFEVFQRWIQNKEF